MLEELHPRGDELRNLSSSEKKLLSYLLKQTNNQKLCDGLDSVKVIDEDDGGMGSIRFSYGKLGPSAAQAEYVDEDGVLVLLQLNLTDKCLLLELDIWKSNFSRLKRYPTPDKIKIIEE